MLLSIKALAITCGSLWGGMMLVVGFVNLAVPAYGSAFLPGMSSVYPGFRASGTFVDVLISTIYALTDGVLGGFFFGWLYNSFARSSAG